MKFRPQLKAVTWGVSLALMASAATTPAFAGGWGAPTQGDTGYGTDTVMGNGLNPRGLDTTTQPDDNGLGPFHSPVAHTPTGAQYSVPWVEPADPSFYGDVEFGFIGSFGDANASKFEEYRDFSSITGGNNGLTINNFNFGSEKNGHYFNFSGGGVSNTDQYYSGAFGSYNDWRLRFFYNETQHIFETDAKLIWNGAGSNMLTLKPQFQQNLINAGGVNSNTPNTAVVGAGGQNQNAAFVNQALRETVAQSGDTTLALYRKKGGLRWDQPLTDKWSFYSSYTVERRTGDRDFGQTGGGFPGAALPNTNAGNGLPIQVVEPIDYTTHEIALGSGYVDDKNALNLSLTASVFQDAIKDVLWQNPDVSPYYATAAAQTAGPNALLNRTFEQFTTPPDNQAYNLNLDYTRMLGFWNGNLATNFSLGRQNQNDDLQPMTSSQGASPLGLNPQGALAFWNSTIGPNGIPTLSRLTSQLHNNVSMANVGLNLQPLDKLSVGAKLRYYGVKNDNDYIACNPSLAAAYSTTCASGIAGSTGGAVVPIVINGVTYTPTVGAGGLAPIYGYLREDGDTGAPVSTLTTANNRVRGFDASWHQFTGSINADYQLASKTSLTFNYDRDNVYRAERERDWTYEDKFKVGFVERGLGAGTLRASYEYDNRTGSHYKSLDSYLQSYCVADDATCVVNTAAAGANVPINVAGALIPSFTANPVPGTKYDLSDRKQNIFVVRYNYMFTETLDAMLTGKLNLQKYPDPLGRDTRSEHNVSAELNWTPDTLTNVYTALTYEGANQSQISAANFASNCTVAPCSYAVGGVNSYFGNLTSLSTVPFGNTAFRYTTDDRDWYFTLGANHKFSAVRVEANYVYTHTTSPMDYTGFNYATGIVGTANNGIGNPTAPTAFSFPMETWNRHQLNISATMPINDKLAIRALYMFDKAIESDWHYDGLSALGDVTGAGRVYLDGTGTSEPYTAHVVGLFAQYKM